MTGLICLWYGAEVDIPPGWHKCDGTAGTPDLRDRFVLGSVPARPPHSSGGSFTHTHTFTGDGHQHLLAAGADIEAGTMWDQQTGAAPATGTTDAPDFGAPPWYTLHWIMKL